VFLEEGLGAFPGERGARLVVARAFVAVEAVSGILVDVDLAVRPLLLDDLHVA
jgi:hypothetical protein